MSADRLRKKHTGEPGNAGQFGTHRRDEADGVVLRTEAAPDYTRLDGPFAHPHDKLTVALELAAEELERHGLRDWHVRINRGTSTHGSCQHSTRTINLGREPTLANTRDEVRNTILHEVAHAIVGRHATHGPKWQAKAAELGAIPKARSGGTTYTRMRNEEIERRNQEVREANKPDPNLQIGSIVTLTRPGKAPLEGELVRVHEIHYSLRIGGAFEVKVPCSWVIAAS